MPKLTIDGRPIEVPAGTLLIEAAKRLGIQIPHFCYHEALRPAGNCRICLVEVEKAKGPMISCMTNCGEGMVVKTQSDLAVQARNGVMEFLLLNHPLDCTICDQAGECKLQRYSYEHGPAGSRLELEKVKKPKNVELSEKIVFDAERCILCTRCIRFFEDVRKKSVLGLVNRGTYNEIAVAAGEKIDDNYSMNIIDICPVGALTATDFRFQSRVWFLKQTDSVCNGCAKGCNITISSRDDRLMRYVPRTNPAVNGHWMCDTGRLSYKGVHSPDRLDRVFIRMGGALEEVEWAEGLDRAAELIQEAKGPVSFVASTKASTEDLWLFKRLASRVAKARLARATELSKGDDFLLQADRTPNSAGADLVGWPKTSLEAGSTGGVVVLGDDLGAGALPAKPDFLIVFGWGMGELAKQADVVLPLAGFAEVDQTYVSMAQRMQLAPAAIAPPGDALPGYVAFPGLERRLEEGAKSYRLAEDAFQAMLAEVPALKTVKARKMARLDAMGVELAGGKVGV